MDIYEHVPVIEDARWQVRFIQDGDAKALFAVYHDLHALPFFNSDHCHGDNFYWETEEIAVQAIAAWKHEYAKRGFVRLSIVDQATQQVIGTFEIFRRISENDRYTDCGLLRMDLRSDYEKTEVIATLLSLMLPHFQRWFSCTVIATKSRNYAIARNRALTALGFSRSDAPLRTPQRDYYDYWVYTKEP